MNHPIESGRLARFLTKANRNTYANKLALKAPPTMPGSEDYHFEADGLVCHDTYWGSRNFIGGEGIWTAEDWVKKAPLKWRMNYWGVVLGKNVDEGELYGFLRQALMQEDETKIPVRGPPTFISGSKRYRFLPMGDLSNFTGIEEILLDERPAYRCLVQGGFI